MVFEQIEKLKQDYTDKYVVVDSDRPELLRFQMMTGRVKTVNMNGRALVEFDALENIGWYDIEIDFLKVVDQPEPATPTRGTAKAADKPAPAARKPAARPTGASVSDVLAAARGAAAPSSPPKKPAPSGTASVQDILAAARGEKAEADKPKAPPPARPSAKTPAQPKADSGQMSVADILAAARGEKAKADKPKAKASPPAQPPAKTPAQPKADPGQMSVADILAAARGQGSPSPPEPETGASAEQTAAPPSESHPASAPSPPAEQPPSQEGPPPTSVDEILAFCRQRDG